MTASPDYARVNSAGRLLPALSVEQVETIKTRYDNCVWATCRCGFGRPVARQARLKPTQNRSTPPASDLDPVASGQRRRDRFDHLGLRPFRVVQT